MAVGNHVQSLKLVIPVHPQTVDNDDPVGAYGDAAPVSVDCKGYRSALVVWAFGAIDSDGAPTAMNLWEADATGDTFTEVPSCDWIADTTEDVVATDDKKAFGIFLDLRKRKRYLQIQCAIPNATTATGFAGFVILGDPEIAPNSASERGLEAQIINV